MIYQLAQLNIAKIIYAIDSAEMSGFVQNLDRINALAEESMGFVWRLKDDSNNATNLHIFNDPSLLVNMSVWKDIDSLFRFAYHSEHVEFFKRRREWFPKMPEMHMCLWYVPELHTPSIHEAEERLTYLRQHGESPFAFTFKKKFCQAMFCNERSGIMSI
jgi:hypothetical protein